MAQKSCRYMEISGAIRKRILEGMYKEEERLPTESEFAKDFKVSRGTIREALLLLEDEDMIIRKRGSGSFVSKHTDKIVSGIENLESWTDSITKAGHTVEDKVLSIDFIPLVGEVAERLAIPDRSPGIRIRSMRSSNGYPLIYAEDSIPTSLLHNNDVWKVREESHSVLYFFEEIGYLPKKFVSTIQAVNANELAPIMEVEPEAPLVLLEGVIYDENNVALAYSNYYVRSDKYQFRMVRSKR